MIARATLALILAGPALVSGMTFSGRIAEASAPAKRIGQAPRERHAQASQRRLRVPSKALAAHQETRDLPSATVASLDDGLAYDTPRDSHGRPMPTYGSAIKAWQVGTASWYGGAQWQGHRMSDGERYEQNNLTAAHLSLPLGSMVRVSRVGDDRSVVVRITDRPGIHRRIIDLSRAAAAKLGMLSDGLAEVRLDPL